MIIYRRKEKAVKRLRGRPERKRGCPSVKQIDELSGESCVKVIEKPIENIR